MKIISPNVEILTPLDGKAVLQHIERCGRVCYKLKEMGVDVEQWQKEVLTNGA